MSKLRISAFILIFMLSVVLLAGCTTTGKEQAGDNKQDTSVTQDSGNKLNETENTAADGNSSDTKKPDKEELLKDMMDVPIEDFEAPDLEGNKIKLSDYKGKIVLLNFWSTWCPPCREEMPLMQKLYDKYKDKGENQDVVILAVNPTSVELRGGTDSAKAENQVRKFIEESGYTFPVLLDKEDKAWSIYQQRGIPTNYIIDKQGIIRYGFSGAFQSLEQMETLIDNVRSIE